MTLTLIPGYELKNQTWLGVGGPAEYFARVDNLADLHDFLSTNQLPITILGGGSNVLIRDGGIAGVVLKLGSGFTGITFRDDVLVCGAGIAMNQIARMAQKQGLSGFEFMADIPGSLGGGLSSNAGAFGRSLSDCLVEIKTLTYQGKEKIYTDFSGWTYRFSPIQNEIFIAAKLRAKNRANPLQIQQQMNTYHRHRITTQPQGVRTAGSTFKNPPQKSAGFLLEKSGLKGYKEKGAEMSDKHANFLINRGATGNQLEDFVLKMQKIVLEKQGVHLDWEIKCLGKR